jgi:uncharacterized membrane protein YbaN (DUF454 family)
VAKNDGLPYSARGALPTQQALSQGPRHELQACTRAPVLGRGKLQGVADEATSSSARAGDEAQAQLAPARWGGRRIFYFGLGWVFFGLGVVGAVLPGLPTTVFMLLAAWAFSHSSARFERWLLEHRWFGASIRRWRAHRVVPARVKRIAYVMMSATFALSIASGRVPWWVLLAQALLIGYGVWFLARLPSEVPRSTNSDLSPSQATKPS